MKKYYAVTTRFYDNGKVLASRSSVESTVIPDNSYEQLDDCDKYTDWFETESEAYEFYAEACVC